MLSRSQPYPPNHNTLKRKLTTKDGWVGDYDFAWLCTPTLPVYNSSRKKGKKRQRQIPPPFFALDEDIPIILAWICGLQHALAMLAGLITPPILFANALNLDGSTQVCLYFSFHLSNNMKRGKKLRNYNSHT